MLKFYFFLPPVIGNITVFVKVYNYQNKTMSMYKDIQNMLIPTLSFEILYKDLPFINLLYFKTNKYAYNNTVKAVP